MKKIILCSLVAMMAVTAANAEIASVKYVDDLVVVAEEVVAEDNRDKVVPTIARTEVIIEDSHDKIIAKDGEQVDEADVDSVVPTLLRTENLINDTQSSLTGIIGDTTDFQPGESVMGFVDANTAAIAEIKHEENGILATAKQYTNDEISELSDSLTGTTGSLTTLTQTVNTLNGTETTEGSVKKQIADAVAVETSARETADLTLDGKISDLETALGADGATGKAIAAAQATADAAVKKEQVGIADDNFAISDECMEADAVCSLVVRAGVAGWEKIRY